MPPEETLARKFSSLWPHLNERQRRLVAAAEARELGRGGIAMVCRAARISRPAVELGLRELDEVPVGPPARSRRPGVGRKKVVDQDPGIVADLEALVEPTAAGDPMSALRWTTKSTRTLAAELAEQGHVASYKRVGEILRASTTAGARSAFRPAPTRSASRPRSGRGPRRSTAGKGQGGGWPVGCVVSSWVAASWR